MARRRRGRNRWRPYMQGGCCGCLMAVPFMPIAIAIGVIKAIMGFDNRVG